MLKILNQIVAHWQLYVWENCGQIFEQIKVFLFNGAILIMNIDEFLELVEEL